MKEKTYLKIKAKDIVPSSVLPPRKHSKEIRESVKAHGIIQFPIVRPYVKCPFKPGALHNDDGEPSIYEWIDGSGRLPVLGPEEYVLVEVRQTANDADVFKISEATHKRDQRSAYENAVFFDAYVKAVKKETGEEGALSRVARESQISPSILSQYLAINSLFTKLNALKPEVDFDNLKSMGINGLYTLSKLSDHEDLLNVALQIEQTPDRLSIEAINAIVDTKLEATPDIEKEIAASLAPETSPALADNTIYDAKSKVLSEKLATMIGKLNTILPQIRTEPTPMKQSPSPETLKIMERTSATLKRLLYYLKKLKKAQTQAKVKPENTTVNAQTSEAKENDTTQNPTQ